MNTTRRPRISAQEFWSNVTTIPESGCWIHLSSLGGYLYGHAMVMGVDQYAAHRIAFVLAHGPIPAGLCVLHRCDVKGCINPDHLEAGTHQKNIRDFFARGITPRTKALKADRVSASMRAWWAEPSNREFLARRKASLDHLPTIARPAA